MWDPFADPADSADAAADAPEAAGGAVQLGAEPAASAPPPPDPWDDPSLEALSGTIEAAVREHEEREARMQAALAYEWDEAIADVEMGPRRQRLKCSLRAARFEAKEIFADVACEGEFKDLIFQACALSGECFSTRLGVSDLAGGRRIALLVDTVLVATVGYCLYDAGGSDDDGLRIEELAVAESCRGSGHGTSLLRWALAAAVTLRARRVTLSCAEDQVPFFSRLGFRTARERGPDWTTGLQHMQALLPDQRDLGPEVWEQDGPADATASPQPTWPCGGGGGGAEPAVGALLLCFLASHISSTERVERFADTLASVARQEPRGPPELFVSWSATTPELREQARSMLAGAASAIPGLVSLEQDAPLSQFLHLAACFRAAGGRLRDGGWVFFSDDDDLWHPRRYHEYACEVARVHADRGVWSVAAATHAVLRRAVAPRAARASDVDRLLAQGPRTCLLSDALALLSPAGAEGGQLAHGLPEYFDAAVRAEQLRNFFLRTPRRILANKFCDRRFVAQFLGRNGLRWFRPEGWLYYYSRADGITRVQAGDFYDGGASFGVEVTDKDRQLVDAHEGGRPAAAQQRPHPVSLLGREDLAFLAASIRASIEEQVISLGSLERGSVSLEDLQAVCEIAADTRASLSEMGADEGLWSWALGLASEIGSQVCQKMQVGICAP